MRYHHIPTAYLGSSHSFTVRCSFFLVISKIRQLQASNWLSSFVETLGNSTEGSARALRKKVVAIF